MEKNPFTQEETLRYSRHLMIPEVGLTGQKRLKGASVLLVGAGGLGSPVSLYLAAAGVGKIGLVDDDVVESSNLQRQIVHSTSRIGIPKVESAKTRLLELNPNIEVDAILDNFNQKNAESIANGYDILVDCADNFATRYLVNDLCVLTGRPDVYGAVYRFEGQVSVFDSRVGPCYRCLFPEPPPPELAPSCSDSGVLGVVPGIIGTLQAAEVIKLILGKGQSLAGSLLLVDTLEMKFRSIRLNKRTDCPICGSEPKITTLIDYDSFCGVSDLLIDPSEMISARELAEKMKQPDPPFVLDVRGEVETQVSIIPGAVLIPLEQLEQRLNELDKNREIVIFCRTGKRSKRALLKLKRYGYKNLKDLTGGINAWVEMVDTSMMQY